MNDPIEPVPFTEEEVKRIRLKRELLELLRSGLELAAALVAWVLSFDAVVFFMLLGGIYDLVIIYGIWRHDTEFLEEILFSDIRRLARMEDGRKDRKMKFRKKDMMKRGCWAASQFILAVQFSVHSHAWTGRLWPWMIGFFALTFLSSVRSLYQTYRESNKG
jgi:hypothetical protein